jgi:hypothetical protein
MPQPAYPLPNLALEQREKLVQELLPERSRRLSYHSRAREEPPLVNRKMYWRG